MCQSQFVSGSIEMLPLKLQVVLLLVLRVLGNEYRNSSGCSLDYDVNGQTFRGLKLISNEKEFVSARREPRLFSFSTTSQDVEVKMEFGVPFMNIPIQGTIKGIKTVMVNLMNGQFPSLANYNPMAVVFIVFFSLLMTGAGFAIYSINDRHFNWGTAPLFFRSVNNTDPLDFATFFESFERGLSRYGIDATACAQRQICTKVQEAMQDVERRGFGLAGKMNTVVEGLTRSKWAMQFVAETAIEDAILTARRGKSCDDVFQSCRVKFNFLYKGLEKLANMMR